MYRRSYHKGWIHSCPTLVIGIDIAKKRHWARMLDVTTAREVGKAFDIKNNIDGFSGLLGKMNRAKDEVGAERIIVAMEPTSHYWASLAGYLVRNGIAVVTVNTYHVKKYKELDDNTPTKSDRKDAWIIATLAAEGRFFKYHMPQGIWADLRRLLQARSQARIRLNSAIVTVRGILDEYFPEYDEVFKNPLGKGSLYVLSHHPFPADLRELPFEQVVAGLKGATSGRVGQKKAQQLLAVARRSVGLTDGMSVARMRLNQNLRQIEALSKDLAEIEAAMAVTLEKTGLASYLLSIPGVGVVIAASLLGEVGNPSRYTNWRQWRRLAGYNLTENSSGERKGLTKISKRGRSQLRSVLYQAALVLVSKNAEFKAIYRSLRHRRQNPLKGSQALVAIACKLLRIMFALVHKGELYDPRKVSQPRTRCLVAA